MNSLDLWIFDLDDTLYLERDFVLSGYAAVSKQTEAEFKKPILEQLKRRFFAGERGDLFTPSLAEQGIAIDETKAQKLVQCYRQHAPLIAPCPDVVPFLKSLRSHGKKTALLSDGWHAVQKNKLVALGLESYFDAVVFTDALGGTEFWKPNPAGFEKCLRELGVQASGAVYLGDNPEKDFHAPKRLGMKSIRVRRAGGEHQRKEAKSPEFQADHTVLALDPEIVLCYP